MIPVARPFIAEEEATAAKNAVLSGWVTQGPKVREFEAQFARYVGSRFACAVSSCTTALHLALLAVGVKPGDVVITVSHSFIATANAVRYCGAEPVFIDIDPDTYNMDSNDLERCLHEQCVEFDDGLYYRDVDSLAIGGSPLRLYANRKGNGGLCGPPLGRIAAILPVHQMGRPCDIERIVALAGTFAIKVVEDAACAIGSEIEASQGGLYERIGRPHGDIACFSLHPRKVITTGEGGMITTNKEEYDMMFRLRRQHGMSIPDTARHNAKAILFEEYTTTAFNYRMTDIQASIGIEQMKKLDMMLGERRRLADQYCDGLKENRLLMLPEREGSDRMNWQSFPIRLRHGSSYTQITFMQELLDRGIATRRGIMNAHQEQPYMAHRWQLPNSEEAKETTVLLPFFNGMSREDADYVVNTLNDMAE